MLAAVYAYSKRASDIQHWTSSITVGLAYVFFIDYSMARVHLHHAASSLEVPFPTGHDDSKIIKTLVAVLLFKCHSIFGIGFRYAVVVHGSGNGFMKH